MRFVFLLSTCQGGESEIPLWLPKVPLWPRKVPLCGGQSSAKRWAKFCGGEGESVCHVGLPFCHSLSAKGTACVFGTVFVESFALARMQAGYESA